MSEHIGDDAALYALGLLEGEDRAAVARHALACEQCARALDEAQADALAMDAALHFGVAAPPGLGTRLAALEPPEPPARPRIPPAADRRGYAIWALAVAATFALFFAVTAGTLWLRERSLADALQRDSAIASALLHSHFAHADMQPVSAGAPAAKMLFARDRSWVTVIVQSDRPDLGVLVHSGRSVFTSRTHQVQAGPDPTQTFFLRPDVPVDRVELTIAGRVVAQGSTNDGH